MEAAEAREAWAARKGQRQFQRRRDAQQQRSRGRARKITPEASGEE